MHDGHYGTGSKNLIQAISSGRGLIVRLALSRNAKSSSFRIRTCWPQSQFKNSGLLQLTASTLKVRRAQGPTTPLGGQTTQAGKLGPIISPKTSCINPNSANLQAWVWKPCKRVWQRTSPDEGEGEDRKLDVREIPAWLEAALQVAYMYMPTFMFVRAA